MKISINVDKWQTEYGNSFQRTVGKHGGVIEYTLIEGGGQLLILAFAYNARPEAENIGDFYINSVVMGAEIMKGNNPSDSERQKYGKAESKSFTKTMMEKTLADTKLIKRNLGFKTYINDETASTRFTVRLKNEEFCIVALK